MKRIKKLIIVLIVILIIILLFTGCDIIKVDNMEDIDIITTSYPLEYILKTLYGEHSLIKSIYLDDVDTYTYEITKKGLKNDRKQDLFIYVNYGRDKDIAVNLLIKIKNY